MDPVRVIVHFLLSILISQVVTASKDVKGAPSRSQQAPLYRAKAKIDDRYIVVFKEGTQREGMENAKRILTSARNGVNQIHHEYSSINGFAATIAKNSLEELLFNRDVKYVEQDSIMNILDDKCIEQANSGWCLERVGNAKGGNKYYYPEKAGQNVIVYVIDTGVNANHADFHGRAKQCANFVPYESGNDLNGHGTGVASLVAGAKAGTAKFAEICGIKVLNARGSGSTSDIVAGINWVTNQKRKGVINLSLGGGYSRATNDAVDRAFASGHFVVVAAGNEAQDACSVSPASAESSFTVAASDEKNNLAKFSNFGKCVQVIAPGTNCFQAASDGKFKYSSGTSFASPLVAGLAAAVKSENMKRSPNDLRKQLLANSAKNEIKNVKGSPNYFVQSKCG